MDDLAAFIAARLDEDEAAANEVHRVRGCGCVDRDGEFDPDPIWCSCDYPARVLREVAAKRAILAEYEDMADDALYHGLRVAIVHLATAWSDHPDYRADWKP